MTIKGFRTYIAIILTALVTGLNQLGILPDTFFQPVVAVLILAGLYFRKEANK